MTTDALTSAIGSIVDEQQAPLRSCLEALERDRTVRETPEALVTVAQVGERQPASSVGAIHWPPRHRCENGLRCIMAFHGC